MIKGEMRLFKKKKRWNDRANIFYYKAEKSVFYFPILQIWKYLNVLQLTTTMIYNII